VDSNKFSKVLRNLVSNAMKFTPENGKVSVEIHLTKASSLPTEWQTEERVWKYANARSDITRVVANAGLQLYGYLRISVTDTGVGLSMVLTTFPSLLTSDAGGPNSFVPRDHPNPAEQAPRWTRLRTGFVQ
jgi:hypothetical protein